MPPVACACSPAWMGCECRCHWSGVSRREVTLRYEYRTPVVHIDESPEAVEMRKFNELLADRAAQAQRSPWLPPGDRESWKRGIWA